MANFSQKNIQRIFIGGAATMTTTTIDAMNTGEIAVFTPGGTRITEATAATEDKFIIVQKRADEIVSSGVIDKNNLVAAKCVHEAYSAKSEQVDYIGFNGTSGSLDVINSNFYHIRINIRQQLASNHGGLYVKHGTYASDASATEQEIADNLCVNLANDFVKEADRLIQVERVNNNAGTALGTGVDTITLKFGSKYFTADDIDDATTNAAMAVGDYLRIGTAVTDPVYKIVALDTTNDIGTLDMPYQGDDYSAEDTAFERIPAASVAASDFGLKLTGIESKFVLGKIHEGINSWTTTLQNFGDTEVTSTAAAPGTGTERQVSELEWFCQGNEGDFYRMGEPNLYDIRSDVSGNYDLIHLVTVKQRDNSLVSGPVHKQFTIAVPDTAPNWAVTGTTNDTTDVLEVLCFGSANGNFTCA